MALSKSTPSEIRCVLPKLQHAAEDLITMSKNPAFEFDVVERLPIRYADRYRENDFVAAFGRVLSKVALKIRLESAHTLGSTAEELALYLIVQKAEDDIHMFQSWNKSALRAISGWYKSVIIDDDIQLLYDDRFETNGFAAKQLGVVNLAVEDWFVSFQAA